MKKTWGEIRKEALNLGFEPMNNYEKQKEAFARGYNWAANHIAAVTGCLVDEITINKTATDSAVVYDMEKLASEEKGVSFIGFSQTGVTYAATMEKVDTARLTDNRFLTLPADCVGEIKVHFIKSPPQLYSSSPDSEECPLPYKWAMLVPYYMAHRLFLEDDAARSGYYWNLAEDMKNDMLKKENQPLLSVIGGIDTEGWW